MKRRWIIAVLAAFLLVAMVGLAEAAEGRPPVPIDKVKVIIAFNRPPGAAEQALVRGHGGSIKYTYHIVPAIAATIPHAAINGLRRNPRIARVEMDVVVRLTDAELDSSWGVKRIGAGLVHPYNTGAGVKVAILDTGIDYNHPDLVANYKGGLDIVNGDDDPMDDDGHGTHVAGTIAAEDNDMGVVGVAPEAELYALKVIRRDGTGSLFDIIAAIEWSVDNGIDVINMSLGWGSHVETMELACDAAYAAGVVVVASAGNSGNRGGNGDNVLYPARYDSVIAVAATDKDDSRASFSSTGPDLELSAPGVSIVSTIPGDRYGSASGTSMACPHVVGAAALVRAANPTWTSAEVREQLAITADDLGQAARDTKYGYGLVDADEAAPPPVDVHDVAVLSLDVPPTVAKDSNVPVDVTVANQGTEAETFTVTLTDETADITIGSVPLTLAPGASTILNFVWDTTGSMSGDHLLKAEASQVPGETDTVDNTKTATVFVTDPVHDVAITSVTAPSTASRGQTIAVEVAAANQGTFVETFSVTLTYQTDNLTIGSETVTLGGGSSTTISFDWDTTASSLGSHILQAEASVVPGETDTVDNVGETTVTVVEKKALHVEVVTNCSGCPTGSYVVIPVTVTDDIGSPVEGAYVVCRIITPKGRIYSGATNTDENGKAIFGYSPYKTDRKGTYTVTADATKDGYDPGSGSTTFEFK